jgi:Domain of unknown function (DUF4136)
MRNWIVSTAAVAMLLAGPAAFAQKVNTDFDPSANFAGYRTYAWTPGTPSPNPLGEQRIHAAVDQQLAAKGFSMVSESPSVYIATHVVTKEQQQLNVTGFGGGPFWGGGIDTTARVETYTVGTLAVDMYDAKTKKLVWRGVGSGTASDKADKNTAKVDKALEKMFKKYPPDSNGKPSR